ncbi:unnamed protein product [Phaeothamnion confervicola]
MSPISYSDACVPEIQRVPMCAAPISLSMQRARCRTAGAFGRVAGALPAVATPLASRSGGLSTRRRRTHAAAATPSGGRIGGRRGRTRWRRRRRRRRREVWHRCRGGGTVKNAEGSGGRRCNDSGSKSGRDAHAGCGSGGSANSAGAGEGVSDDGASDKSKDSRAPPSAAADRCFEGRRGRRGHMRGGRPQNNQ